MKLEEYKDEQEIYIQGEPSNNKLYFLLAGTVDLLIKERRVAVVGASHAVGEFPVIDPSLPFTVTVRAREPSLMATVREDQFLSIGERYPQIWKNMAKVLVARLHATRELVPDTKAPCVFIGHGKNQFWTRVQLFLQNHCGLRVVSFESEPRAGKSIGPIQDEMRNSVTFAVLVLTEEDQTAETERCP